MRFFIFSYDFYRILKEFCELISKKSQPGNKMACFVATGTLVFTIGVNINCVESVT